MYIISLEIIHIMYKFKPKKKPNVNDKLSKINTLLFSFIVARWSFNLLLNQSSALADWLLSSAFSFLIFLRLFFLGVSSFLVDGLGTASELVLFEVLPSACSCFTCILSWDCRMKLFEHDEHLKGFSIACVNTCLANTSGRLNCLLQISQEKGLMCKWVIKCLLRLWDCWKPLPQMLQMHGFSPVWTRVCLSMSHNLTKALPQRSHWYFFGASLTFLKMWIGKWLSYSSFVQKPSLHLLHLYGYSPGKSLNIFNKNYNSYYENIYCWQYHISRDLCVGDHYFSFYHKRKSLFQDSSITEPLFIK